MCKSVIVGGLSPYMCKKIIDLTQNMVYNIYKIYRY
jgi:hypothetical protein